jgi:hypothetical protein
MHGPEHYVKKQVSKYLKDHSIYAFMPVQMGLGATTLDYLCCWRGHFVGIECKAGKGKLTNRQQWVMEAINEAGGKFFVVDDKTAVNYQMQRIDDYVVARSQA